MDRHKLPPMKSDHPKQNIDFNIRKFVSFDLKQPDNKKKIYRLDILIVYNNFTLLLFNWQ